MAPNPSVGVWGTPTATIDWCEDNYEVTYYIAEFWNTVSNLIYILPPVVTAAKSWMDGLEWRFLLCYAGVICIGIGSLLFHGTLLYEMQVMDEMSMVYASAVFLYTLFEHEKAPKVSNYPMMMFMAATCVIITVVYLWLKMALFHQCCYGLMAVAMIYRGCVICKETDKISRTYLLGCILTYALAVILWNMDNIFCSQLRQIRHSVGLPVTPMTELHAWWHILTGISTHLLLIFACRSRYNALKKESVVKLYRGVVPYVSLGQAIP